MTMYLIMAINKACPMMIMMIVMIMSRLLKSTSNLISKSIKYWNTILMINILITQTIPRTKNNNIITITLGLMILKIMRNLNIKTQPRNCSPIMRMSICIVTSNRKPIHCHKINMPWKKWASLVHILEFCVQVMRLVPMKNNGFLPAKMIGELSVQDTWISNRIKMAELWNFFSIINILKVAIQANKWRFK